jgi:hypothetical protein
MNIDWSKAPEGATHYGMDPRCTSTGGIQWYLLESGKPYRFWWAGHANHWEVGAEPKEAPITDFHPITPSAWNGEGLPPVGTVCEFSGFNPEETLPTDPRVGDQVTVIAHFMSGSFEMAAFTFHAPPEFEYLQVAQGAYGCFRPIRTPEQIAAEECDKAVQAMLAEFQHTGSLTSHYEVCEVLHKAGYRKQVAP